MLAHRPGGRDPQDGPAAGPPPEGSRPGMGQDRSAIEHTPAFARKSGGGAMPTTARGPYPSPRGGPWGGGRQGRGSGLHWVGRPGRRGRAFTRRYRQRRIPLLCSAPQQPPCRRSPSPGVRAEAYFWALIAALGVFEHHWRRRESARRSLCLPNPTQPISRIWAERCAMRRTSAGRPNRPPRL